jgi:DNA polymerase-3 subunit alpha
VSAQSQVDHPAAVAIPGFVHLRVHSEFSIADGLIKVRQLASEVKRLGMPAVGLTDQVNLFGLIKFYQACVSAGVKPLVGADLLHSTADGSFKVTLFAMNQQGYKNLISLVSIAYLQGPERGSVSREEIFSHNDGLLVLSGGVAGDVGSALVKGDQPVAAQNAQAWRERFPGRYYLELSRTGRATEELHVNRAVALAAELQLPVVATNEVCFFSADDFEAHETRVCIYEGRTVDDPRRDRRYNPAQHLKTPAQMLDLFGDIPEALANTIAIAQRCNVVIDMGTYYLPNYPVEGNVTLEQYLERCAQEGLSARLEELRSRRPPLASDSQVAQQAEAAEEAEYRSRLSYELGVINQMGFPGYFLIVMEFIAWARENDIPVGPGRGSGSGSLVAYALRITDLDPMVYDLLFERFLNPERVSMPDFDVDFCMEGRDRVISHVSQRYGQDAVSQIITFSTMAAKAVVRDVARVQGKPYGLADKLSKLIPFEVGMTLTKAVEQSSELADFIADSEEVGEIMDMAYKLEGIVRGVGRHAGGVVIAPSELTDFVPLYVDDQSGGLVSQFDKDDVETAGLVKFDFLGLKTLTVIDWAVKAINAGRPASEPALEIERIPLDDEATFEFLRSAETTGVFQLESRGMKDLIRRLLPDSIDDIIALVALFRPGPLQSGAVDDFIDRKHGKAKVKYLHPSMEPVLRGTYGVMLYQEQVMQSAQALANFSLGQADLLRRAMGKKKPEEMAKVREQFLTGCAAHAVDEALAGQIFDLMEKFSGYAFNKSHSATYALVSFQTAWLKTHYPAQFMAATLSADMQNTDKVVTLVDEVRRLGLPLRPPSVNYSEFRFSAQPSAQEGAVVYGLGAVRGVGEGPVESLVAAREATGAFVDLPDFCRRVDARKANKRVLQALIRSGAMDDFADTGEAVDDTRARLLDSLAEALQGAEQAARDQAIGMADMFGDVAQTSHPGPTRRVVALTKKQRLAGERESLGLYLTGHPIDEYLAEIQRFCPSNIASLRADKRPQKVAGLVVSARTMRTRRGLMGFIVLDDRSGRLEVTLFSDIYESQRAKLVKDAILVIEGEVQPDDYSGALKMRAERVHDIEGARCRFAEQLVIGLGQQSMSDVSGRLRACLEPYVSAAGCVVAVAYEGAGARGQVTLGEQWRVTPSDDLLHKLSCEFGEQFVDLSYSKGS